MKMFKDKIDLLKLSNPVPNNNSNNKCPNKHLHNSNKGLKNNTLIKSVILKKIFMLVESLIRLRQTKTSLTISFN